jgi:DNA polymerase-1
VAHDYEGAPGQIPADEALALLEPLLRDPEVPKVGQNAKYDLTVLRRAGSDVAPVAFDTMIAAHLVDSTQRSLSLDHLALRYLGHRTISYEEVAGKGKDQVTLDRVAIERVTDYAAEDADVTLQLAERLERDLREAGLEELFETVEMPLVPVLEEMERHGVRLDTRFLETMSKEMEGRLRDLEKEVHELAGVPFNLASPPQLREILFERLGLQPTGRRTQKTRKLSTSAEVLEQLARQHPLPERVLEYREVAKLKSTYVDALPALVNPETGRVHTSFHQTGAATGRLSSSDPNLQNIPVRTEAGRRIRKAFVPEAGWLFLAADYSQVELRVLAHLAEEPELVRAFERGEDIHRRTAALVAGVPFDEVTSELRTRAKTVNFGILYGMSEFRLAREQGMSREEARDFIEAYFDRVPRVSEYIEQVQEHVRQTGEVTTLLGRIRRFPELLEGSEAAGRTRRPAREQALRAAVNTTIQGTAADLMKKAMIAVHHRLRHEGLAARMLLQVHDELLFESPPGEIEDLKKVVREEMESVYPLRVPLIVDLHTGRDWMEAK